KINRTERQEKREEVILKLIKKKIQKYKTEKIIVYYNIVNKIKRFTEALGYSVYYYNTVEKNSILKEFIKKDKQIIIAISLLNISINILDIRCIIYMD
ncbi:hypothetical protein K469DRAFT_610927, partial [Zopfia rhizophila CBS 207.26]